MNKKTSQAKLAKMLNISPSRSMEAVIKAQLIAGVVHALEKNKMTHAELALKSGLSRSAVTGILSGSLQNITIDRVFKLVEAVDLVAEVKLRKAV